MNDAPAVGQRWVSEAEPELGLGMVERVAPGRVQVRFLAADERRVYAWPDAPLRRVRFKTGDVITLDDGSHLTVSRIERRGACLVYVGDSREAPETMLAAAAAFSKPEDRLVSGPADDPDTFTLRLEALLRRSRQRQSPVRGFTGSRVQLIAHQLGIADEVCSRLSPRVLLADEVGLGKTIEAGLIIRQFHVTGRAARVLVLVPEPLIHQWFVELLRRFHLLFAIFDEERCTAIEEGEPGANPFLDSQLVLLSTEFLTDRHERAAQAVSAGWDLLVVDEAHHLTWSPQLAGPAYSMVEALAVTVPAVLLVTATPQQLGPAGHFARLRLLDPARYTDLDAFLHESEHYERVAKALERVQSGAPLTATDHDLFAAKSPRIRRLCEETSAGGSGARESLVAALLDSFGTGRVMFRNTRAALTGFPERKAHLVAVDDDRAAKIKWLAGLLRAQSEEKFLLITSGRFEAESIRTTLLEEMQIDCALFHEDLSLLQRDRHAAWFAEPGGARLLVCSEIGSEGRNFQFAHHLVLWDLPRDPELLEQRIGRLDRIGQTGTIHLHVPFVPRSASEVMARWYHEGLNAFEKNLHGGAEIAAALEAGLLPLLESFDAGRLEALIRQSKLVCQETGARLARGYDRLLQFHSHKAPRAAEIIRRINEEDADEKGDAFFLRLMDHCGAAVEDLDRRTWVLRGGHVIPCSLPAMQDEGLSVTFDRARALSREDITFLSANHPLYTGAVDFLLGSTAGTAACGQWQESGSEALLLEAVYVIECPAPATLHADRFLPATPVRVVVDQSLADCSADRAMLRARIESFAFTSLPGAATISARLLPAMLEKCGALAAQKSGRVINAAVTAAEHHFQNEIDRMEDLAALNDHVDPSELEALRRQQRELVQHLRAAHLRLDAVRLVWRN